MPSVQETIPQELRRDVDAALTWFNERESASFEVTGIVDADAAIAAQGPRELRLVLCGGDRCEQRSFRVEAAGDDFDVTFLDEDPAASDGAKVAELDPPPGARRAWLDRALSQHAFVVLLFYRGFW